MWWIMFLRHTETQFQDTLTHPCMLTSHLNSTFLFLVWWKEEQYKKQRREKQLWGQKYKFGGWDVRWDHKRNLAEVLLDRQAPCESHSNLVLHIIGLRQQLWLHFLYDTEVQSALGPRYFFGLSKPCWILITHQSFEQLKAMTHG